MKLKDTEMKAAILILMVLINTRVINIKSKQPFDVYIGNRIRFHPAKYPQSKWGNPYAKYIKKYGRYKVIEMYKEYIMNKPELLKLIPIELKDKIVWDSKKLSSRIRRA
jgi:hypothetical protein